MGDVIKKGATALATGGVSLISDKFRTGKTAAKKAQAAQTIAIQKQKQVDELGLAEEESNIARKRSLAKSGTGGRASLIKTSATGVRSNNLGGTV